MKPVRAVIFDFGGVLYTTPNPRWLRPLQRLLRIQDTGLILMTHMSPLQSPLVMDIMTGKTDERAAWEEFARNWRVSPDLLARLQQRASSPKRLNVQLLTYIKGLRSRCRTAVLTNAGTGFRRMFCEAYDLESYVDQVIISAEEKLAKPDERIFQLAAARLEVQPDEAVLIDDLPENVEGALAAGMQALLYQNNQQVMQCLEQLLSAAPGS
jgi:epoxide hydrolase-like predicted phosphatase